MIVLLPVADGAGVTPIYLPACYPRISRADRFGNTNLLWVLGRLASPSAQVHWLLQEEGYTVLDKADTADEADHHDIGQALEQADTACSSH